MKWAWATSNAGHAAMSGKMAAAKADRPIGDEELVRRVGLGDAISFRILVDRHADRWFALSLRLLRRRDAAEDVVQDVFLRLWAEPGRFRPLGARFSTWAYRVVVNRCLDRLRLAGEGAIAVDFDPPDPKPDALGQMIEAERDRRLGHEIAILPERQRAALALTYTTGLSNSEAAKVMDISLKAFEALLVRAKRALREALVPTF